MQEKPTQALEQHRFAEETFEKIGDKLPLARVHLNKGKAYLELAELAQEGKEEVDALRHWRDGWLSFQSSAELFEQLEGHRDAWANAMEGWGAAAIGLGQAAQALAILQKALQAATGSLRARLTRGVGQAHLVLAEQLGEGGQGSQGRVHLPPAEQAFRESAALFEQSEGHTLDWAEAMDGWGTSHLALDQAARALATFRAALAEASWQGTPRAARLYERLRAHERKALDRLAPGEDEPPRA